MTKKELYTCDICHIDYASKDDCRNCEKSHIVSTVMKDFRYSAKGKYPHEILVKFTDGVERWYKE